MTSNAFLVLAAIGALVILCTVFRWDRIIWAVMFLVVCEGALRKWIFPGFQAEIYLIKDALLISGYIGFLMSRVRSENHNRAIAGLRLWVLLALLYFALQLANPNSPSMLLTMVG